MKSRPLPVLGLLVLVAGLLLNIFDILPHIASLALSTLATARAIHALTSAQWQDMTSLERTITLLEPLA